MARPRRRPPGRRRPPEQPLPARPAYTIEILPAAAWALAKLPTDARRAVSAQIDTLAAEPRPQGVEKLSGEDDLYRVRAGNYRIIYRLRDDVLTVAVVKVGDRKDVYRNL